MKFSLVVLAHPETNPEALSALRFAQTLHAKELQIHRVFFYGAGTLAGHVDHPIAAQWSELAKEGGFELVACSTSAQKRGVFSVQEAPKGQTATLSAGFENSGLGQLIEASINSDRVVTFA